MTRKLFENTSLLSEIPLFKKMMETAMNFTVISGLNIPMNRTNLRHMKYVMTGTSTCIVFSTHVHTCI